MNNALPEHRWLGGIPGARLVLVWPVFARPGINAANAWRTNEM